MCITENVCVRDGAMDNGYFLNKIIAAFKCLALLNGSKFCGHYNRFVFN